MRERGQAEASLTLRVSVISPFQTAYSAALYFAGVTSAAKSTMSAADCHVGTVKLEVLAGQAIKQLGGAEQLVRRHRSAPPHCSLAQCFGHERAGQGGHALSLTPSHKSCPA